MRILSLAPSNTEILFALGLEKEIVAVTNLCDYPKAARGKVKIGSWITTMPREIENLSPDYIFTSYFLPEPLRDWKGPGKVIHFQPKTLEGVYQTILQVGKLTGTQKQATLIVDKMKTSFTQIRNNVTMKQLSTPRVYMEEWPIPPFASGNWVSELVEIAGGIGGIVKKGKPSREFLLEDLIRFDADCMIFHWCGYGKRFNKDLVKNRPGWHQLRAVKNDKLFAIDDSLLNRPGPRLVEGAAKIQKILLSL